MTIEIDFNTVMVFFYSHSQYEERMRIQKAGGNVRLILFFFKFLLFVVSYKNYRKSQGCIVRPLLQVHSSEEQVVLKSFGEIFLTIYNLLAMVNLT